MPAGLPWHREDLGDVVRDERLLLKYRLPILAFTWRIGAPADTTPDDRTPDPATQRDATGRTDASMDLQADKKVTLSGAYTDEVGNPVDPPTGAAVAYTVDDPTVIALTDNGDGTAEAAATGLLGVANVHAEATFGGRSATGDLQIVVVSGDAERFEIVAGEPTEVTPDA